MCRESWERGQPDYEGAASFDNILKKVDNTICLECVFFHFANFFLSDQRNNEQVKICFLACFSPSLRRCHPLCDIRKEGWLIFHHLHFNSFTSRHNIVNQ